MTRYSRSVIPGRPADAPQHDPNLDRLVLGAKRVPPAAANDRAEPDFLPLVDDDEADILAGRANFDRRKSADRRAQPSGRRASEYAPLRDAARPARADESRRGPLLLGGALLIVAVFGVVVWTAYSDGLATDEAEVTPELSTAGAFKTPPRVIEAAPLVTEPVGMVTGSTGTPRLDGGMTDSFAEERPEPPAPAEAAAAPPPSKVMAPPPAPLKSPAPAAAPTPPAAKLEAPKVEPPRPTPAKPLAAAPVPAPGPIATTPSAYRPSFAAYGDHVVQIAATSSTASADAEFARMSKAWPDLLSGAERFVQEADVNGKTVYRLRVGSFASKADAAAFCTAFKARGGNCYPAVK
jgi:hypothetical protein